MLNEREVYFNGEYRRWDEANVHVMSHSFGRGSAIFEVIGFHDTPAGPAVFRLDEYLSRFWKSASLLEMEPPLTQRGLQEAVLTLVKRSALKSGFLKMYGFYPEISFKILPPQRKFQVAVCLFSEEEALGQPPASAPRSVTACVSRWRRLDPRTVPIEAKVAANYVNGMVARMESREKGFDYAILFDTQGFIAEGGTESLFLVRKGRLLTSALGTVLQSITRKTLLEVAGTMGIETFTGLLNPEALDEADEIFFSGTSTKLLPVRQVGDRILNQVPGPLTRRLSERMAAITSGGDEQFRHWLFPA
ncbi:MAG: aminotransferase class IV [Proteobacteria bacterium]|nr:aminotransferase class IV [Pseudomonadota bacterium]